MYATALTVRCIADDCTVVDPSAVVADRCEIDPPSHVPHATIRDVDDRLGVEISGRTTAVDRISTVLSSCSTDSIPIDADLPRGGVYVGEVAQKTEHGAIVETGIAPGFLPFGKTDTYLETSDNVIVQVVDPEPPWTSSKRPVLGTEVRVPGTYLSLVPDADTDIVQSPDDALAFTIQRLDVDVPTDWGIQIHHVAQQVDLSILAAELTHLNAIAEDIESALASTHHDSIGRVYEPLSTVWCRFGRSGRFALDTDRNTVTPTMEGHHRIKSTGSTGGRAVDLLEGYHADVEFDPDIVFGTFGPDAGDRVRIDHGKPIGTSITLGRGTVTDRSEDGTITVERTLSAGGTYDALDIPKEAGDTASTTFVEGRWWYPTVYRDAEGEYKGTYVNVCTPLEILPDSVRYVDLYVDVVKSPNGEVSIVDLDELTARVDDGVISLDLADRAESVAEAIVRAF